MSVKLIVGLGNYPEQYAKTKHNVGFLVTDHLCKELNLQMNQQKFNGRFTKVDIDGDTWIIAQPLTLMNLSGDFVVPIAHFFKIDSHDILIVSDDVDTPLGSLRIKKNGSSGGQNGLKDIINKLGTEDIKRIKIGIGRPANRNIDLASYVLSSFTHEERNVIDQIIRQATDALVEHMNGSTFEQITSKYGENK